MNIRENDHQLLATMFADIQGYTALMQNDEKKAVHLVKVFKETVEREVEDHGGKVIQFYGDAIMAVFPSSVNAVSAAKIMQRAFNSVGDIPVRIGINSGDVLYRDGNIFGDSVNIASRIESMGVAGSVLLSKVVQEQIKNKKDLNCSSLGLFEFKNVEEGIEVFALDVEGVTRPLPTQLKGKFKRGFQVPEANKEEIELEKKAKIKRLQVQAISSSVILFAIWAIMTAMTGEIVPPFLWILFPIIPIWLGVWNKITSVKLYNDPNAFKRKENEEKRREKELKREMKRKAKLAKREERLTSKRKTPPPISRPIEKVELPEEDLSDELELKEIHRLEREKWNDEDFV